MVIRAVRNNEVEELASLASRVYSDAFGGSISKKEVELVIASSHSPEYSRKIVIRRNNTGGNH